MKGKSQVLLSTRKLDYRPCITCKRHPDYPEIPAVTLHSGDLCLVCGEKGNRKPEDLRHSVNVRFPC